jgi:predicted outer membrane protein
MRNLYGWSMVAVICMAGIVSAQVRTEPRPGVQPRPAVPGRAPAATEHAAMQGTSDQQIAAFLYGAAHNEVELAKFAQQHAKSDEVKEFAAHMIKDHSEQADHLARFAGNLVTMKEGRRPESARRETGREEGRRIEARRVPPESREGAPETRRDADARRDEARGAEARGGREEATERAGAMHGPLNWTAIHKEIADQCLKSTKEELSRYKGDDFDKAYIGQQLAAHMQLEDALKVLQHHASGQLKQQLEQDLETIQEHFKEAQKIMDEQKDQGSKNSSGRSERSRE